MCMKTTLTYRTQKGACMLNIVLGLEKNNLKPVLDSFGVNSESYIIPRERSEAVIARILQEISGRNGPGRMKIMRGNKVF